MDEGLRHIAVRLMESKLNSLRLLMDSPMYKASLARSRAAWAAKPWYEKVRIRASVKARNARIWLGEKIAGRCFDDYQ
jgi:hypothetical protein